MIWWERDPEAPNCRVVVNDEEQYALWPHDAALPAGWRDTGMTGTADECADYVDRVWTDLTPASMRADRPAAGNAGVTKDPSGAG
ncbi:MbtH family protein [Monashia sp. NPDC004114]